MHPEGAQFQGRNHYTVVPAPWVAGCSDIGTRHRTNQDALCVAASSRPTKRAVLVVSDGVSTALGAEHASLVAVEEACSVLIQAVSADGAAEAESFSSAFMQAHEAVLAAGADDEPAACTLGAATVVDGLIRVGSIGDSRAYWFGEDGVSWQLTKDDSMAQARMMLGVPREEAERSLQAHSITRWLGRNATDVNPALVELRPDSPGWVVVCSDGLWNYASSPEDLAIVFEEAKKVSGNPVELTESLVAWANSCGGRDNITVALAYCGG